MKRVVEPSKNQSNSDSKKYLKDCKKDPMFNAQPEMTTKERIKFVLGGDMNPDKLKFCK